MKEMTALKYLKLKKELAERCSTFRGCNACDHRTEDECYELFFEYEFELECPEETLKMMEAYAKERRTEKRVTIDIEIPQELLDELEKRYKADDCGAESLEEFVAMLMGLGLGMGGLT